MTKIETAITAHATATVVYVPLKGGLEAVVDKADFDSLCAQKLSPTWVLNSNGHGRSYVRSRFLDGAGPGNNVQVARLILPPAARGLVLSYRDGNPLNLRRSNLMVAVRRSRAKGWEWGWTTAQEFAV